MQIWVDADACPGAIKNILIRAAKRTGIEMTLVANHPLRVPPVKNIHFLLVPSGDDVADNEILKRITAGDLVITADIPLANEVLKKKCYALSPHGELFNLDSIGARLSMRNFMESLRAAGVKTGGPEAMNPSTKKAFADQLDRILTQAQKNSP